MSITIRFEKVSSQRLSIDTFCKVCKKKLKRDVREEHTVNPWNVIEGTNIPKSRHEVWKQCEDAVKAKCEDLRLNGTVCRKCSSD